MVARVLFLSLPSWGNTITPHRRQVNAPGPLPSSTLPPVPTREQHLPVEGSKGVEIVCNSRPFCAVLFLNG